MGKHSSIFRSAQHGDLFDCTHSCSFYSHSWKASVARDSELGAGSAKEARWVSKSDPKTLKLTNSDVALQNCQDLHTGYLAQELDLALAAGESGVRKFLDLRVDNHGWP